MTHSSTDGAILTYSKVDYTSTLDENKKPVTLLGSPTFIFLFLCPPLQAPPSFHTYAATEQKARDSTRFPDFYFSSFPHCLPPPLPPISSPNPFLLFNFLILSPSPFKIPPSFYTYAATEQADRDSATFPRHLYFFLPQFFAPTICFPFLPPLPSPCYFPPVRCNRS